MLALPRPVLAAFTILPAAAAVVFLVQPPALADLWPFAVTTPLSHILMASMLAAAAASNGLPLLLGRGAAFAGVGLDVGATFLPMAAYTAWLAATGGDGRMWALVVVAVGSLVGGIVLFRAAAPLPFVDSRPMPIVLRVAFGVFTVALVLVGTALVIRTPNVLPWNVPPELSTFFGCMYLGAAAYFAYGLRRPVWDNAIGQLAGFLAYDLVLIVPFLQRVPTIPPTFALSQWLYLVIVVGSGLLAVWYLVLDPRWRIVRPAATTGA